MNPEVPVAPRRDVSPAQEFNFRLRDRLSKLYVRLAEFKCEIAGVATSDEPCGLANDVSEDLRDRIGAAWKLT